MTRLIAFPYYGGKYSHLSWLLPLLPTAEDGILHYCEPFGGSMAVLLNRMPCPIETYNDLDERVVNFFRVLRNYPDELMRLLNLTPYSRKEYDDSWQIYGLSDIEWARRFYISARHAYGGKISSKTGWGRNVAHARQGMSGRVSAWWGGIDKLVEVASRILRVQIECWPAEEIIRKYDNPKILFYCDPPYTGVDQGYKHQYSDQEHIQLAKLLNGIEGLAAVSGYQCALLDELYAGWVRHDARPKKRPMIISGEPVAEALYTNYVIEDVR